MASYEQDAADAEDLVARATDEQLQGPEWQLNMTICDMANANHAICDDIVRSLHRRLQSGSPRVVMQTMVLTETVVKNGPPAVHAQVASRAFVNEVAALTDGSLGVDVQHKALELIKQWADAFTGDAAYAAFQDTYRQLKIQGVVFPEAEQEVPIFTPPSSTAAAAAGGSSRGGDAFGLSSSRSSTPRDASPRAGATAVDGKPSASTRAQQIAKLHADLQIVMEKIDLYRDFRSQGEFDSSYEDVVDFLRQCQPRMNTLIEGGIVGKIDEQTLEQCLNVNDSLIKVLEESRTASAGAVTGDLLGLESPPRASMQRMSLI